MSFNQSWFKPLRGKIRPRSIVGFDIEGVGGPDGFVCGAVASDSGTQFYTDREEMYRVLLEYGAKGAWLFCHNLQYDLPLLEGENFTRGRLLFTRNKMLWADFTHWGRKVRFYDSQNLFPRHSVSAMGALVDRQKLTISDRLLRELTSGKAWGHIHPENRKRVKKYCERDAEIVYLAVCLLQDITNYLGGNLKGTIAGVSMDIYRRAFHSWPWRTLGPKTNLFARPGYYGGRTENFLYGRVEGAQMYDVTSLYPFVQSRVAFPHPNHIKLEVSPDRHSIVDDIEGIAQATVDVPESYIPPLPFREGRKLFFPFGELEGCWTTQELRQALAFGCKIRDISWVLGAEVTFNPFTEFIEHLFGLRMTYLQAGQGHANIVKLILNSLYGRWGLNPEFGLFNLERLDETSDLEDYQGGYTTEYNGSVYVYAPIVSDRIPTYTNVLFAAQVSSAARLYLLDELTTQGHQAAYCDTDSIITTGEVETLEGLGGWRTQMINGAVDLLGPKEYALHNEFYGSTYHVKGVPQVVAKDYIESGVARFTRALSIREAMRQGQHPAEWVETYRSQSMIIPKRLPLSPWDRDPGPAIMTRPYQLEELREACQAPYPPPRFLTENLERVFPSEFPAVQLELERERPKDYRTVS